MDVTVRDAQESDLPTIVDIYNESIPGGWSTADTSPVTVADRVDWFRKFNPARRPIWLAESGDTGVGWVGLTSFYGGRPAYDATAEVSLYIRPNHHRRGLGRVLLERMITACPRLGVTTLLAMYFDHNPATARLTERFGFVRMGHLTEIAVVQGMPRGVVIAGLRIPPPTS